nr:FbpB family small basic protein [Aquibacillus sediminis]
MGLRRKPTFEELVQENRNEILKDDQIMSEIEEKIDQKYNQSFQQET